jgi:hypothetical protein
MVYRKGNYCSMSCEGQRDRLLGPNPGNRQAGVEGIDVVVAASAVSVVVDDHPKPHDWSASSCGRARNGL